MEELLTMTVADLKESLGYVNDAVRDTRVKQMPHTIRQARLLRLCVQKQNLERAIARKTMGVKA